MKEAVKDAVDVALGEALGTVVTQATQLAGGASKEAWAVTTADGRELLLRRAGGGVIHVDTLSLRDEFAVISAARDAGVRVPEPIAYLGDLDGRDAFVMELVHGETIGRRIVKAPPAGLDSADGRRAREGAFDPGHGAAPAARPGSLAAPVRASSTRSTSPIPRSSSGSSWCRERLPLERPRVVNHGDFRIGNLMVDETRARGGARLGVRPRLGPGGGSRVAARPRLALRPGRPAPRRHRRASSRISTATPS